MFFKQVYGGSCDSKNKYAKVIVLRFGIHSHGCAAVVFYYRFIYCDGENYGGKTDDFGVIIVRCMSILIYAVTVS